MREFALSHASKGPTALMLDDIRMQPVSIHPKGRV
jgi:hypothetical protein